MGIETPTDKIEFNVETDEGCMETYKYIFEKYGKYTNEIDKKMLKNNLWQTFNYNDSINTSFISVKYGVGFFIKDGKVRFHSHISGAIKDLPIADTQEECIYLKNIAQAIQEMNLSEGEKNINPKVEGIVDESVKKMCKNIPM